MKPHRIHSLSIIGGFLDGVHLQFDAGLNCIIGARGTGKTTILELIRYALDQLPRKDLSLAARKRVETLVENNLQGGRVEMLVETGDGVRYIISRSAGEEPIVLDANRQTTQIAVRSLDFFRADIFSQNEVETIADTKRFQLDLLDTFEPVQIAALNTQIEDVCHEMVTLARQEEPLRTKLAMLQEKAKELPGIEEKLKAVIGSTSGSVGDAVNKAHENKALRDRESRAVTAARASLVAMQDNLAPLIGRLKTELNDRFVALLKGCPNSVLLTKLQNDMRPNVGGVDAGLKVVAEHVSTAIAKLDQHEKELLEAHNVQEMEFRKLIEQHKAHQAQSVERTTLERRRNELAESGNQAEQLKAQLTKHDAQRRTLLDRMANLRDQRFAVREQIATRLTGALSPTIRVSICQDGNTENYQELIENTLKGQGVQQGTVAQKLASQIPPSTLAEIIRREDSTVLMKDADLNSNQAIKVIAAFNSPPQLAKLETVELYDAPAIKLKDGASYKDSTELSTGQKCTTILPILLMENANPLLIDQPEDNLDNRFVFETVVESIQQVKKRRQLILVTHNPNIPVLGDASRVMVMESDGEHGRNVTSGNVDDCRSQIVNLLEGGVEAFRQRGTRYNLAA